MSIKRFSLFIFSLFFFLKPGNVHAATFNVIPTALTPNTLTISWKTDTAQNSKFELGTTTSYGTSTTDTAVSTSHSLTITGLDPNTTYHYRVGNITGTEQSADFTIKLPYDFGIITNSAAASGGTTHLSDEYEKGVRIKTVELAWDQYETADNTWNSTYISTKQNEISDYRAAGFNIVLDIGSHYTPSWVTSIDANALFKNQYGDTYAPASAGKNIANVVFNNTVRSQLSAYMSKVFSDLGTNFYAVRAGGLWFGELHYPDEEYNGRTNAFWGYDANAQGTNSNLPTGVSVNPVPGWIPNPVANGTFENGTDGNWTLGGGMDTITASDAHRGTYSLKMVNPGAFTNVVQQDLQVVSGRTYRYSVWAKTSDGDTSTPPCLQITTTAGVEIVSPQCAFSTSYQQITGTFTPAVNTVRMNLLTYASEGGVTLTFDDVSLMDSTYSYDATNANATSFWNWYRDSLTNYQNWQITQYRNAGFSGNIYMMYPGYGVRTDATVNWVTDAISYDLSRTTIGNTSSSLQSVEDWGEQIPDLPGSDSKIFAYSTWIDGTGTDGSADKKDWSPAKYLAYIADANDRPLNGENTGANSYSEMQTAVSNMTSYGYSGLTWFDQTQLYGGTYATISNFATQISGLDVTAPYNASLSINSGATSTTDLNVSLSISAIDNVSTSSNMQMIISNNSDFAGTSYESYSTTKSWSLNSGGGQKFVYIRFKDAVGNISNVLVASTNYSGSSSGSSSSSEQSSVASPYTCDASIPTGFADLFQINRTNKTAKLYFTPINGNVGAYHVVFGIKEGLEQFGSLSEPVTQESNTGVQSISINELDSRTDYWFKVAPVNGCAVGSWSNWLQAKKSTNKNSIIYRYTPQFIRDKTR